MRDARPLLLATLTGLAVAPTTAGDVVLVEAEAFETTGGWLLDQPVATELADRPIATIPVVPVTDYLIDDAPFVARLVRSADGRELILDNGLVRRTWRLEPGVACVGYDNLMTGQAMLRSVRPEARVTIDGVPRDVGGLTGQPNHAFLTMAWLDAMESTLR